MFLMYISGFVLEFWGKRQPYLGREGRDKLRERRHRDWIWQVGGSKAGGIEC